MAQANSVVFISHIRDDHQVNRVRSEMIGELFMVEVIDFDDQRMFTKVYQSMDIENVKKAVEKEVCEMLETTAEDTVESKWPQENTEFAVGNINVSGGNYRVSIEMISPIIV